MTKILRVGVRGPEVVRWQNFLIGKGLLRGKADGVFGPVTASATRAFQRANGLTADGVVGPQSYATALQAGFDPGFVDRSKSEEGINYPPPPRFKPLVGTRARQQVFGRYEYEHAPTRQNPEQIRVLDDWRRKNIVRLHIPQLVGIPIGGRPSSGTLYFHRLAAEQLTNLWKAWEDEGLLDLVLTFDGGYAPRFIRGSTRVLSNHAFGTAFDINARWNGLGAVPALVGQEGSVRALVKVANRFGFYWGGHFKNRPDGMHFEVARIL